MTPTRAPILGQHGLNSRECICACSKLPGRGFCRKCFSALTQETQKAIEWGGAPYERAMPTAIAELKAAGRIR